MPPRPNSIAAPPDLDEAATQVARGRAALSNRDVAGARLILRWAAEHDDPQAALALGETYDPVVLKGLGIIKFADPAQAQEWYRRAADLGSAGVISRLDQPSDPADPRKIPDKHDDAEVPGVANEPNVGASAIKSNDAQILADRQLAPAPAASDAIFYRERGIAAYRSGDFMGAIGNVDAAIQLDPDDAQSYNIRGNVWDELGISERALADYDKAIRINPNNPAVFHDRAILWQRKGELDKALVDFDRAIRFSFDDANIYCDRGLVWYEKGGHERAIADFNRAIKLDPDFAVDYINRGLILHSNREFAVAFTDSKPIRVDPSIFDVTKRTTLRP
jgi:tetratricopeptide (TPR) repeat protein